MIDFIKYQNKVKTEISELLINAITEFPELGFKKKHIAKCEKILINYLKKLHNLKNINDDLILNEVKKVVLALNKLNAKTNYALIETEERETIWEVIQESAVEAGLNEEIDDVTEEWREW